MRMLFVSKCIRLFQLCEVLKTLLLALPPQSCCQATLLVDDTLATAMHALQSTVSTTLQAMPLGLAFSQDMFLNIPLLQDCHTILAHREQLVMIHCFVPTKSISTLITRLVKTFSSMTKCFKERLQDPLKFFGSTPTAL